MVGLVGISKLPPNFGGEGSAPTADEDWATSALVSSSSKPVGPRNISTL
jgi:hypothetical protein